MPVIKYFTVFLFLFYTNLASGQTGGCSAQLGHGIGVQATPEGALATAWQSFATNYYPTGWGPVEIESGGWDPSLWGRLSGRTPPFINGPPEDRGIYKAYPFTVYIEVIDRGTWEPAGERMNSWQNFVFCTAGALAVVLTGSTATRPAGAGGTSTITLTAKVTSGGTPKPGVALSFSVDVTAKSGGHDHGDPSRPKGTLSATQGTTDANGEVKLTFRASEIAGSHIVKANCATCFNSPATKEIQVKVPDLLPISPNAPQNADGTFGYSLTSVDQTHQGNGRYHHNQYYLTEQSQINLQSMITAFAAEGWGTVALNDASLYWGGRYDITSNWSAPHAGHREGREIDVSFVRAGNPISTSKQKVFYKKFCETKTVQASFSILHHYVKNPHFHVYLEKQTACWKSGN